MFGVTRFAQKDSVEKGILIMAKLRNQKVNIYFLFLILPNG